MASQATQETLTSLDRAEFLGTSTRRQQSLVTPKLDQVYGTLPPRAEGEPPRALDFDAHQEANAELLDEATRTARATAHAYRQAKVKLTKLRKDRNEQGKGLRQHHRNLRKSFDGTYGPNALPLVGLDAPPVQAFTALREQNLDVVDRMRTPDLASRLGDPLAGQEALKLDKLANGLEKAVQSFEKVTNDITDMIKIRDEALVAKKEAQKYQLRVLANVARIQEGYYRLAGLDDLADRIRVTIPKRSTKPSEEPPDDTPADDTPADDTPADDTPAEQPTP